MALHAVPDEPVRKPAARRRSTAKKPAGPKSVTQAAKSGTPRELLVAMRDRVAQAVEDPKTSPRDLAALTRRLTDIVREIEQLDTHAQSGGGDDEAEVDDAAFDPSAI